LVGFLDSGSNICAIHDRYRKFIPNSAIKPCHIYINGVLGKIFCTRSAELPLQIGPLKTKALFYLVRTLPKQVLIGNEFMAKHGISLHPGTNSWKLDGKSYPFLSSEELERDKKKTRESYCLEAVKLIKSTCAPQFEEYRDQYYALLDEFEDIFSFSPGVAKCEPMRINTGSAAPIKEGQRRMSAQKAEIVEAMVQDHVAKGWLEPCEGPWRANWVVAPKKGDEGFRPCGDYQRLNNITVDNAFPMPSAQENLDFVGQSHVFSTFDLTKGYYQIPLAEEDMDKTALWSPSGLYRYRVMPFGLKNAPKVFQWLMNQVLAPMLRKSAMVYLDDVIINSKTPEEHLRHLREFFTLIEESGLGRGPSRGDA